RERADIGGSPPRLRGTRQSTPSRARFSYDAPRGGRMQTTRRATIAAALLLVAFSAQAQTANLADADLPAVAVPNASVAGAEEPAGLSVNPAAPGFVRKGSAQYFHEERNGSPYRADALFLSLPL